MELAEHVAHAVQPPVAVSAPVQSLITHYGEQYNGRMLGCGNGLYSSGDPTIVAVGPARAAEMPCGTQLQVCGPGGCILAQRQDSCPGCSPYVFDLSESGFAAVCGLPTGVCSATVSIVQTCEDMDLSWQERPERQRGTLDDLAQAPWLAEPPESVMLPEEETIATEPPSGCRS